MIIASYLGNSGLPGVWLLSIAKVVSKFKGFL
jgi:hypothetical protein